MKLRLIRTKRIAATPTGAPPGGLLVPGNPSDIDEPEPEPGCDPSAYAANLAWAQGDR